MSTILLSVLLFLSATCNDHIIREPVPEGIVLQDHPEICDSRVR